MSNLILIFLFILWTIFGSFASVLIHRIYTHKSWIMTGRSHCPECNSTLTFLDLFPVFSYLFLLWKCRHCHKKIPAIYPILEITMGIFFVLSWAFLVDLNLIIFLNTLEIIKLILFLTISFVIVIMIFYDILYMLVADEIMIPSILTLFLLLIWASQFPQINNVFWYYKTFENDFFNIKIVNALLGSFCIYTFFYLQILIPGVIYSFKNKKPKITWELLVYYPYFPIYMIYDHIKHLLGKNKKEVEENIEDTEEIPSWMWWWDLRIAIFMWLVWGFKIAMIWLLLAYLIWSIVWIIVIIKKGRESSMIPFWPFLWIWLFLSLIFYDKILNLYFLYVLK